MLYQVFPSMLSSAPHNFWIHRIEVNSEHCLRKCLYESFRCFLQSNYRDCVRTCVCHFLLSSIVLFTAEDRRVGVWRRRRFWCRAKNCTVSIGLAAIRTDKTSQVAPLCLILL